MEQSIWTNPVLGRPNKSSATASRRTKRSFLKKRDKGADELMYIVHSSTVPTFRDSSWLCGDIKNFNYAKFEIPGLTCCNDLLMTCNGRWLLVYSFITRRMSLQNTIFPYQITIPPFPLHLNESGDLLFHRTFRYLLPLLPGQPDWSLVCVDRKNLRYLVYQPSRNKSFREYSFPDVYKYDARIIAEASYKGKVFVNGPTLLMIDTATDPISTETVEESPIDDKLQSFDFYTELVESDDELFKVQINQHEYSGVVHSIIVHQLNAKEWKWQEVHDIGHTSFFIGDLSSSQSHFLYVGGSRRNSIYLTEPNNSRRVYRYSLDDRSLTFPEQNALKSQGRLCQWLIVRWPMQEQHQPKLNQQQPSSLSLIPESTPIPCLLYSPKNDGLYRVVDSCEHKVYALHIPELANSTLYSYEDGWFIVHKPPREIFFFNILTRKKIVLPPRAKQFDNEEWALYSLSFSAPPPAKSVVIAVERVRANVGCVILTHIIGENSWIRSYFGTRPRCSFHPNYNRPIFQQEDFHLLGRYAKIGLHNPLTGYSQIIPKNIDDDFHLVNDWPVTPDSYLVCQGDRLMAIFMDEGDFPCGIYEIRLDGRWKEVSDFKDECLYLGRYTSFFVKTLDERRKNAICLNKFKNDGYDQFVEIHPFDNGEIEARKNRLQKTVYFSCNSWITLPKSLFKSSKRGH